MKNDLLPHVRWSCAWTRLVALTVIATLAALGVQPALAQTSSIDGFIWNDADGDTFPGVGEARYGGVTLNLYLDDGDNTAELGADDALVGTTTTAAIDPFEYVFTSLSAGSYWIEVVETGQPFAGWTITSVFPDADANPYLRTVNGTTGVTVNFGYQEPASGTSSIGDYVWNDIDGDATLDMGEVGLDGVTVTLYDAGIDGACGGGDDTLQGTTATVDGAYDFTGLPASTYCIDVDETSGPIAGWIATTSEPAVYTLADGEDYNDADFGFRDPNAAGSIGDLVWYDYNANGVVDAGEPGEDGVDVDLNTPGGDSTCGTSDDVDVTLTSTLSNGAYSFPGLAPGVYCVDVDQVDVIPGSTLTTGNDPLTVTLSASQNVDTADFGFEPPAQATTVIAGEVFQDWDGDGVRGAAPAGPEEGFANLTVNLYEDVDRDGVPEPGGDDGAPVATDVTDAAGAYSFGTLPVRAYWVDVDDADADLAGYTLSTGNDPQGVTAAYQTTTTAAPVGYEPPATTVSGQVIDDDAASGISGASVGLWRETGGDPNACCASDTLVGQQVTNVSGDYSFSFGGPPTDTYYLFVDPATLPDPPGNWTYDGAASTFSTNPGQLTLTAGQTRSGDEFHFDPPITNSISGTLWADDANGDGVIDAGETTRFANVTVDLIVPGVDCASGAVQDTMMTAADGFYQFRFLSDGDYCIRVNRSEVPLTHRNNRTAPASGSDSGIYSFSATQTLDSSGGVPDNHVVNFGYQAAGAGTISGVAWIDLTNYGARDAGEYGLAGAQIDLYRDENGSGTIDAADGVPLTLTTPADGSYSFADNLPAGDYLVDAGAPVIYVATTASPVVVALADGATVSDVNFGFRPNGTATLGDLVWEDDDADGAFDSGTETGLSGVRVNLYLDNNGDGALDGGDTLLNTQTTNGTGNYGFPTLPDGDYLVDVDDADVTGFLPTAPATNQPQAATITGGADELDIDFGFVLTAQVSGRVFDDATDADGVQDAGEGGLDAVTVNLYLDQNGNGTFEPGTDPLRGSDATDANGDYTIGDLQPGNYFVDVDDATLPAGVINTTNNQPPTATLAVTAGGSVSAPIIGYAAGGAIGDFIWEDADGDGTPDGGEAGLGDVEVNLYLDDGDTPGVVDASDTFIGAQTTQAAVGTYGFTGLFPGVYLVDIGAVPGGYVLTSTPAYPLQITLSVGQNYDSADFGFAQGGAISGRVWYDENGDGVEGGAPGNRGAEPGINGVTVRVYRSDGDGVFEPGGDDVLVATLVTASDGTDDGTYTTAVTPATYHVDVDDADVPTGLTLTGGADPALVTVGSGGDETASVGYDLAGGAFSVGGVVFQDVNGNAAYDSGTDTLITGDVQLDLWLDNGDGSFSATPDDVLASTVTVTDGNFSFANLPEGDYFVDVFDASSGLTGYTLATANDPAGPFALSAGNPDDTVNFGYIQSFAPGGRVWNDLDGDEVQDAGEPGIQDATVTLNDNGGGVVATTLTNATGDFTFAPQPPGLYSVTVAESPAGELNIGGVRYLRVSASATAPLDLTSGPDTAFFAYAEPAVISGVAWYDDDGEGDPDEFFLPGITANLYADVNGDGVFQPGGADGAAIGSDITDANGEFFFFDLLPGPYWVDMDATTAPAAYTLVIGQDPPTTTVVVNGGDFVDTVYFGFDFRTGAFTISGELFRDDNQNAVRDGVEPVIGAPVALILYFDGNGDGALQLGASDFQVAAGNTDAGNGSYAFNNLPDGDYLVDIVLPDPDLPGGAALTSDDPLAVTIAAQSVNDADFGFFLGAPSARIFGRVWDDLDADGVPDPLELPLDVDVFLYASDGDSAFEPGAGDTLVDTVATIDGDYEFLSLAAADYWVQVDPAMVAGYEVTTAGNPLLRNPGCDTCSLRVQFGFRRPFGTGVISGRVWEDLNDSGPPPGAGEAGLNNIEMFLWLDSLDAEFNGNETLLRLAYTDSSGNFTFDQLPAGLFHVEVSPNNLTLFANYVAAAATVNPLSVTLTAGQQFTQAYFGYIPTGDASVTGRVWNDADGDGTQDAGETGLNNVVVRLYRDANANSVLDFAIDTLFREVATSGDGNYLFDNLPDGTFFAYVDTTTIPSEPGAPTLTGGTNPSAAMPLQDDDVGTANFGFDLPNAGVIAGVVYDDQDGDATLDAGEPGLEDVNVQLFLDRDGDGQFIFEADQPRVASQLTAGDGSYSFANIAVDRVYFVRVSESTLPAGFTRVNLPGNPNPRTVDMETGAPTRLDENFAYFLPPPSYTLTPASSLWDTARPGQSQLFNHTLTNTGPVADTYNIFFNCNAVPAGGVCAPVPGNQGWSQNDRLEIIPPSGPSVFVDSGVATGASITLQAGQSATLRHRIEVPAGAQEGDEDLTRIVVQSQADDTDVKFADDHTIVIEGGSIQGVVFRDDDGDGTQGPAEQGIASVPVSIFQINGAQLTFVDSDATNATGQFAFTGLAFASYAVFVDDDSPSIPAGYSITNPRRDATVSDTSPTATVTFPFSQLTLADPSVQKTVSPATAPVGSPVTFTLTLRNTGSQAAQNVVIEDPISTYLAITSVTINPASEGQASVNLSTNVITFNFPQVDPTDTIVMTIATTVNQTAPSGAQITNQAFIRSFEGEPTSNRQSQVVTVTVGAPASPLVKEVSLTAASPGQNITYTLRFTNNTAQTIPSVTVSDTYNALINFNSASVVNNRGTFVHDLPTRTITFTLTNIAVGETITMTINAQISASTPSGTQITNVGTYLIGATGSGQSNTVSTLVSGTSALPLTTTPPATTGTGTSSTSGPFGTGGPTTLPETGGRPRPAGDDPAQAATTARLLFLILSIVALVPALALIAYGLRRDVPRIGVMRWRVVLVGMVSAALLVGVLAAGTEMPVAPLLVVSALLTLAILMMGAAMVWRDRASAPRDRLISAALSGVTVVSLIASAALVPYTAPAPAGPEDKIAEATPTTAGGEPLAADLWEQARREYAARLPSQPEVIHRIAIPALKLNRAVVEAAYEGDSWNITSFDREVAHLEGTSYPGLTGNTVLAGHVTLARGGFGPFKDLARLTPGDVIVLYGAERQYVYQVQSVEVVGPTDIEVAYPTDEPSLTLVTCTNWSRRDWSYLQRLIVRATLLPDRSATYF